MRCTGLRVSMVEAAGKERVDGSGRMLEDGEDGRH